MTFAAAPLTGDAPREVVVGLAFLAVAGLAYRKSRAVESGTDRRWLANYRNTALPSFMRNAPLLLKHTAALCVCWGLIALTHAAAVSGLFPMFGAAVVVVALFALSIVPLVTAVVGSYRVPERLKPAWFREVEAQMPPMQQGRLGRLGDFFVSATPLFFGLIALIAGLLLLAQTLLRLL